MIYLHVTTQAQVDSNDKVSKVMQGCCHECGDCHSLHLIHRFCGNRHCPNCQQSKADQWLNQQMKKLLPTHFTPC